MMRHLGIRPVVVHRGQPPELAEDLRAERIDRPAANVSVRPLSASTISKSGRLPTIAAGHTGRGTMTVRNDPPGMADRHEPLERVVVALSRPGVGGVLVIADILEVLLLAGALDGKGAIPSSPDRGQAFRQRLTIVTSTEYLAAL
jgi:hypothetical protein